MAISQAMCTSFKVELLNGIHAFSTTVARGNTNADSFKLALYTSSASLGAATTDYSSTNEVANGNGYTTGGNTLVNTGVGLTSTTAFTDFSDTSFTSASFTANGCLIYNDTNADRAVCAIAFGSDKTVTSGTFTIQFPTADADNAILRIA